MPSTGSGRAAARSASRALSPTAPRVLPRTGSRRRWSRRPACCCCRRRRSASAIRTSASGSGERTCRRRSRSSTASLVGDRRALALLPAATVLIFASCAALAPPDARLCAAAQTLTAAITLTATAIDAGNAGDAARSQGLATQARSVAELAATRLKGMPDEAKTDPVWLALQDAYLGTA